MNPIQKLTLNGKGTLPEISQNRVDAEYQNDKSDSSKLSNSKLKQKLFQLRENAQTARFEEDKYDNKNGIDASEKEKLAILKEGYELSIQRADELFSTNEQNIYLKVHGQKASRVYAALSSLIYASISAVKVNELEEYVKKSAAQLPCEIFDLYDWNEVMGIAKQIRDGNSNSVQNELASLKKQLKLCYFLSTDAVKNIKFEFSYMKNNLLSELLQMRQDFSNAKVLIKFITEKLNSKIPKEDDEVFLPYKNSIKELEEKNQHALDENTKLSIALQEAVQSNDEKAVELEKANESLQAATKSNADQLGNIVKLQEQLRNAKDNSAIELKKRDNEMKILVDQMEKERQRHEIEVLTLKSKHNDTFSAKVDELDALSAEYKELSAKLEAAEGQLKTEQVAKEGIDSELKELKSQLQLQQEVIEAKDILINNLKSQLEAQEVKLKEYQQLLPEKTFEVNDNKDVNVDVSPIDGDFDLAASSVTPSKQVTFQDNDAESHVSQILPNFEVDDVVECNFRGKGIWHRGRIMKDNYDGTYNIDYGDGVREKKVQEPFIRLVGKKTSKQSGSSSESSSFIPKREISHVEGDLVKANYRGKGIWHEGLIVRDNGDGTYVVSYGEGVAETNVPFKNIKLLSVEKGQFSKLNVENLQKLNEGRAALQEKSNSVKDLLKIKTEFPTFEVGNRVEVNYRNKGRWYQGVVYKKREQQDGVSYDIDYDDGEKEIKVPIARIRFAVAPPVRPLIFKAGDFVTVREVTSQSELKIGTVLNAIESKRTYAIEYENGDTVEYDVEESRLQLYVMPGRIFSLDNDLIENVVDQGLDELTKYKYSLSKFRLHQSVLSYFMDGGGWDRGRIYDMKLYCNIQYKNGSTELKVPIEEIQWIGGSDVVVPNAVHTSKIVDGIFHWKHGDHVERRQASTNLWHRGILKEDPIVLHSVAFENVGEVHKLPDASLQMIPFGNQSLAKVKIDQIVHIDYRNEDVLFSGKVTSIDEDEVLFTVALDPMLIDGKVITERVLRSQIHVIESDSDARSSQTPQSQLLQLSSKIADLEVERNKLLMQIQKNEQELKELKETNSQVIADLTQQIVQQKASISDYEKEIMQLKTEKSGLLMELNNERERLLDAKKRQDDEFKLIQDQGEGMKSLQEVILNKIEELKGQRERDAETLARYETDLKKLQEDNESSKMMGEMLQKERKKKLQEEYDVLMDELSTLMSQEGQLVVKYENDLEIVKEYQELIQFVVSIQKEKMMEAIRIDKLKQKQDEDELLTKNKKELSVLTIEKEGLLGKIDEVKKKLEDVEAKNTNEIENLHEDVLEKKRLLTALDEKCQLFEKELQNDKEVPIGGEMIETIEKELEEKKLEVLQHKEKEMQFIKKSQDDVEGLKKERDGLIENLQIQKERVQEVLGSDKMVEEEEKLSKMIDNLQRMVSSLEEEAKQLQSSQTLRSFGEALQREHQTIEAKLNELQRKKQEDLDKQSKFEHNLKGLRIENEEMKQLVLVLQEREFATNARKEAQTTELKQSKEFLEASLVHHEEKIQSKIEQNAKAVEEKRFDTMKRTELYEEIEAKMKGLEGQKEKNAMTLSKYENELKKLRNKATLEGRVQPIPSLDIEEGTSKKAFLKDEKKKVELESTVEVQRKKVSEVSIRHEQEMKQFQQQGMEMIQLQRDMESSLNKLIGQRADEIQGLLNDYDVLKKRFEELDVKVLGTDSNEKTIESIVNELDEVRGKYLTCIFEKCFNEQDEVANALQQAKGLLQTEIIKSFDVSREIDTMESELMSLSHKIANIHSTSSMEVNKVTSEPTLMMTESQPLGGEKTKLDGFDRERLELVEVLNNTRDILQKESQKSNDLKTKIEIIEGQLSLLINLREKSKDFSIGTGPRLSPRPNLESLASTNLSPRLRSSPRLRNKLDENGMMDGNMDKLPNYEEQVNVLSALKKAVGTINEQNRNSPRKTPRTSVTHSIDESDSFGPQPSVDVLSLASGSQDKKGIPRSISTDEMHKHVVKIQKVARSYLARLRVKGIKIEIAAAEQGLLVAYKGTKQGDSGWYMAQDLLFYFCLDQGDFVLLCGPITVEMYELVVQELRETPLYRNNTKFEKNISMDRLGLHGTRMQLEILLDDIVDRDNVINEMKQHSDMLHSSLMNQLRMKEDAFGTEMIILERRINVLQELNTQLTNEINKLRVKNIDSAFQSKIEALPSEQLNALAKVGTVVRGFLGRSKATRVKRLTLSKNTGVLLALPGTNQGESGWYCGPNGWIYYFVLQDGNWIQTAGPIRENELQSYTQEMKQILHSPTSSGVLTQCPFQLVPELSSSVLGENAGLFMATKSKRLYVALSLDYLVPNIYRLKMSSTNNSESGGNGMIQNDDIHSISSGSSAGNRSASKLQRMAPVAEE